MTMMHTKFLRKDQKQEKTTDDDNNIKIHFDISEYEIISRWVKIDKYKDR